MLVVLIEPYIPEFFQIFPTPRLGAAGFSICIFDFSIRVARTVQSRIGALADGISGRKFSRTRILIRTSKLPDGILIFETVAWRRHGEKLETSTKYVLW
mgnify:FL=1